MSISRRNILKAMAAVGAAPQSVARVSIGQMGAAVAAKAQSAGNPVAGGPQLDPRWSLRDMLDDNIVTERDLRYYPHVVEMRSWSSAFKRHVATQEMRERQSIVRAIDGLDDATARLILAALK